MSVFFNDTATTEIYTLSLHDALPILLLAAPAAPRALLGRLATATVPDFPISAGIFHLLRPSLQNRSQQALAASAHRATTNSNPTPLPQLRLQPPGPPGRTIVSRMRDSMGFRRATIHLHRSGQ